MAGHFRETVDFDPTAGEDTHTAASQDAFVIFLDEDGGYERTTVITGPYTEDAETLLADSTDALWVTGSFATQVPVDFDPTCEVIELSPHLVEGGESYLAKMVCLEPSADANGDGDVDMHDWARLQACLTGDAWTTCGNGCAVLDFDRDNDIDMSDYADFVASFNGPTGPP